jgi:hypothetical protein
MNFRTHERRRAVTSGPVGALLAGLRYRRRRRTADSIHRPAPAVPTSGIPAGIEVRTRLHRTLDAHGNPVGVLEHAGGRYTVLFRCSSNTGGAVAAVPLTAAWTGVVAALGANQHVVGTAFTYRSRTPAGEDAPSKDVVVICSPDAAAALAAGPIPELRFSITFGGFGPRTDPAADITGHLDRIREDLAHCDVTASPMTPDQTLTAVREAENRSQTTIQAGVNRDE